MDPKSLSNLDPKLQETYARVMGTTATSAANPAAQTPPPSDGLSAAPTTQPGTDQSSVSSTPVTPTPIADSTFNTPATVVAATPAPTPDTNPAFGTPVSPFAAPAGAAAASLTPPAAMVPHETSPVLKIAYIIGGVIFFAVYTIFWIKIFNLPFIF